MLWIGQVWTAFAMQMEIRGQDTLPQALAPVGFKVECGEAMNPGRPRRRLKPIGAATEMVPAGGTGSEVSEAESVRGAAVQSMGDAAFGYHLGDRFERC